jgi:hypothetical protein
MKKFSKKSYQFLPFNYREMEDIDLNKKEQKGTNSNFISPYKNVSIKCFYNETHFVNVPDRIISKNLDLNV